LQSFKARFVARTVSLLVNRALILPGNLNVSANAKLKRLV
jgi:hypothetical protein